MKSIQHKVKAGKLNVNEDDPFELFVASTYIRYCYYSETQKILGNTYGMCVLQVNSKTIKLNFFFSSLLHLFTMFKGFRSVYSQLISSYYRNCKRWWFGSIFTTIFEVFKTVIHLNYGCS